MLWVGVNKGVNGVDWDMVLWNPSTGDYKILPTPCPSFKTYYHEGKQLQGLGYCNDNYKMVRVICDGEYRRVDVYTLKSNSWKKIIEDVFKERHIFYFPNIRGTVVNGLLYWLVVYEFHYHSHKKVLGFDLKNEKLTELPLPSKSICNMEAYLTVIEGSLGMYCITFAQTRDIIVWKMREIE